MTQTNQEPHMSNDPHFQPLPTTAVNDTAVQPETKSSGFDGAAAANEQAPAPVLPDADPTVTQMPARDQTAQQAQMERIEDLFREILPMLKNPQLFALEGIKAALSSPEGLEFLRDLLLTDQEFRGRLEMPFQPKAPDAAELTVKVSAIQDTPEMLTARYYDSTDPVFPNQIQTFMDQGQGVQISNFRPEIEEKVRNAITEAKLHLTNGQVFYVSITKPQG